MASKKLTTADVKHVAKLAKLKLSKDEVGKFVNQLSEVVSYIDELAEVPTDNIEPTSQTTGLTNVTRKDEVKSERILTQEEALSGSDNIHNGYFKVPYVFEGKR
jgi:aspartyl-tRNA(Asn)/glutamyl-tRNA(Gln) amidotransferase subunit C